jgi:hypothetical protein
MSIFGEEAIRHGGGGVSAGEDEWQTAFYFKTNASS